MFSSAGSASWLSGFEYVRAAASEADGTAEVAAVDYILELAGPWVRAIS